MLYKHLLADFTNKSQNDKKLQIHFRTENINLNKNPYLVRNQKIVKDLSVHILP